MQERLQGLGASGEGVVGGGEGCGESGGRARRRRREEGSEAARGEQGPGGGGGWRRGPGGGRRWGRRGSAAPSRAPPAAPLAALGAMGPPKRALLSSDQVRSQAPALGRYLPRAPTKYHARQGAARRLLRGRLWEGNLAQGSKGPPVPRHCCIAAPARGWGRPRQLVRSRGISVGSPARGQGRHVSSLRKGAGQFLATQ